MKKVKFWGLVAMACMAVMVSCKNDEVPVPVTIKIEQKELLVNGNPAGGLFTFYNIEMGTVVVNADSASSKWDFGMRFEKFIINSNASGPGTAQVQIKDGVFDALNTAPETGYAYDTTATQLAIKGNDWYNYDPITRSFSPKAGKVFFFKTASNKYAKIEMLSADPTDDNGNAVVPPTRPTKIKYKFRQSIQTNGTRNF
jgi:hypothetical protein